MNVPLQQIGAIASEVPDKSIAAVRVLHERGAQPAGGRRLKQMGYTDARNIGGIGSWRGTSARGGRLTAHRRGPRRLQRSFEVGRNLARRVRLQRIGGA